MRHLAEPAAPASAPSDVATPEAKPPQPNSVDHWPSAWQTWRRYWYIGRWNYAKGLLIAGAISGATAWLGHPAAAIVIAVLAIGYVLVSGFGLWLLYGPPAERIFDRWLGEAKAMANPRIVDIHFGTWRCTRAALERLPDATVHAIGVQDPEHESEQAVVDVWKFERPPASHPRFTMSSAEPNALPSEDRSADIVMLGFGIHEVHAGPERDALMRELKRVLRPDGKVLLMERGWSPWLALVFGPLFLHFTPAKEWEKWLSENFETVQRESAFAMVDLFVASQPKHGTVD